MNQDHEHLKLLSIFHYVVAGITALFALFPIFHLAFGIFIVAAPETFQDGGDAPPAFLGWLFIGFAVMFILIGWTLAVLIFQAGRNMARRKRYTLCFVVAALECILMPYGTVLGVFTIIVLMRDSVKTMFQTDAPVPVSP